MSTTATTDMYGNLGSSNQLTTIISFTNGQHITPSLIGIVVNDGNGGGATRVAYKPVNGAVETVNATNNSAIPCTGIAMPLHSKSGIELLYLTPNGGSTTNQYYYLFNINRK